MFARLMRKLLADTVIKLIVAALQPVPVVGAIAKIVAFAL
jgi:hypothetical protein